MSWFPYFEVRANEKKFWHLGLRAAWFDYLALILVIRIEMTDFRFVTGLINKDDLIRLVFTQG